MKLVARWNSKDGFKADKAVGRINNQEKLARIAVEARSYWAREAAVEKLTAEDHQTLLAHIATTDQHWFVRELAIEKLTPADYQPLLAEIATKDCDKHVRRAAVEKLVAEENQSLLVEIATKDKDPWVCETALKQLISANNRSLPKEIIAMYGKGLNGKSEYDRDHYAHLLRFIYEKVDAPLKEQIASFNGIIIQEELRFPEPSDVNLPN
ncbi:MAG: HEAT repeat domain-containing protein [Tannerellaceae bacterium]|nr:HEAT repeat domain-containing protein [Tannerellaceae bacterium]